MAFVASIHYLHFAIILALLALILIVTISLCTRSRSPAKLRRVTFWTRHAVEPQELSDDEDGAPPGGDAKDDDMSSSEAETQLTAKLEECDGAPVAFKPASLGGRMRAYLCGTGHLQERMTTNQLLELQRKRTDIHEPPTMKRAMLINAAICAALCVFLHVYWR